MTTPEVMAPPRVYFLHTLAMFNWGAKEPQEVIEEWTAILKGCDPESLVTELQREADRLGFRLDVAATLARAERR